MSRECGPASTTNLADLDDQTKSMSPRVPYDSPRCQFTQSSSLLGESTRTSTLSELLSVITALSSHATVDGAAHENAYATCPARSPPSLEGGPGNSTHPFENVASPPAAPKLVPSTAAIVDDCCASTTGVSSAAASAVRAARAQAAERTMPAVGLSPPASVPPIVAGHAPPKKCDHWLAVLTTKKIAQVAMGAQRRPRALGSPAAPPRAEACTMHPCTVLTRGPAGCLTLDTTASLRYGPQK